MKKKYNTLNEEMNRMKSLFGESRLYGNLVDKEEEIITEQYKFFDDLSSAFKLASKKVDTKNLNRFINYVANDISDVVRYLDDANFKPILEILVPTQNWDEVAKTVKNIERNFEKIPDATDEVYKEFFKNVIAGIPEEGGMRNNIIQMMNNKRYGAYSNLPALSGRKEIVKTTSGEVAIGTKNADGVIVYKNKSGEIIPVEQIKKIDDDITVVGKLGIDKDGRRVLMDDDGNVKSIQGEDGVWRDLDGNPLRDQPKNTIDVDFELVPEGTSLPNLDGKTVAATEENVKNVLDSVGDKIADETKKGNKVAFTMEWEGEEGAKVANEWMDKITGNKGGTSSGDEVLEDMTEEIVEETGENPEVVKKTLKDRFKNFAWGTRFWWNPTTYGPNEKWLAEKWGKNVTWTKDANRFFNTRGGKIIIRFFTLGTSYEIGKTILDPDRDFFESGKNNIFRHTWNDITRLIGTVKKKVSGEAIEDMTLAVIEDTLLNIGDTDVKIVMEKVLSKAMDEILYINSKELNEDGSRKSMMTCTNLSEMTTDDEVIKHIIEKHSNKEIANELERLKKDLGGTGSEDYQKARDMMDRYFKTVVEKSIGVQELKEAIGQTRTACEEAAKQQEEIDYMNSEEYTVVVEGGNI